MSISALPLLKGTRNCTCTLIRLRVCICMLWGIYKDLNEDSALDTDFLQRECGTAEWLKAKQDCSHATVTRTVQRDRRWELLDDTQAVQSVLISADWTVNRHHWQKGFKPIIFSSALWQQQKIQKHALAIQHSKCFELGHFVYSIWSTSVALGVASVLHTVNARLTKVLNNNTRIAAVITSGFGNTMPPLDDL